MTDEQFELSKKRSQSQFRTASKWAQELLPGESLIVLKGVNGELCMQCHKGNPTDIIDMLHAYIANIASYHKVSYAALIGALLLSDEHAISVIARDQESKKEEE